jgi:DNA-binding response OmpR family regulator
MVEEMVRELGHSVWKSATSISAAREALNRQLPDVAILDVNVKGELSFEIAHLLKQRGIPVVFLTGYDSHHFDGTEWEYTVRVQKPASIEELGRALAFATGRGSQIGNARAL